MAKGKTAERGYGYQHQLVREMFGRLVAAGQVRCARCAGKIPGRRGEVCPHCGKANCGWDLGHDDFDRSKPQRPEHACCNRATQGRRNSRAW